MPTDPYELLKQIRAQYGLPEPPDPFGTKGTPAADAVYGPGQPIVVSPGREAIPDRTIPGYTPDYNAIVAGDPLLRQELANLSASGIASEAQRRGAVQRAVIGYGETPALQGDLGYLAGDIDPLTRQLASQNTGAGLSTTGRMTRTHSEALSNLRYALAARGMLRSGATGVGVGQEGDRYKQARYDAANQLIDYLSGVSSAWAEAQRNLAIGRAGAQSGARSRAISENPPVAPTTIAGEPAIPPLTIPGPEVVVTPPKEAVPATDPYDPYAALRNTRVAVGRAQRAFQPEDWEVF